MSVNELGQAREVIIDLADKTIRILNPTVIELDTVQGKIFQLIGGEMREEMGHGQAAAQTYEPSEEDVALVALQAGVSEDEARRALIESNGDLARAILTLKKR